MEKNRGANPSKGLELVKERLLPGYDYRLVGMFHMTYEEVLEHINNEKNRVTPQSLLNSIEVFINNKWQRLSMLVITDNYDNNRNGHNEV